MLYAGLLGGFAAFFLFDHEAMSQMYFAFWAFCVQTRWRCRVSPAFWPFARGAKGLCR